ncbi:hypothetical protein [Isoptericola sp. NPDC056578]|uniref:hypothetical protein n=1 Tax=unclassified Isoptericola TaxID=2623355 RepID=UPI0036BF4ACE
MRIVTNVFRQHDVAPENLASALCAHLTREWAELHQLASTRSTVRRWSRTEQALAGFARPGDIVDAIDAAEYAQKDEMLIALVRLFQGGQQLAGRTVLQAMLPKLMRVADRVATPTSSKDTWDEDRRHIAVAEFWDVMSTYPTHRRPRRVASNLSLDTLHRVTRTAPGAPEISVPPTELPGASSDHALVDWKRGLAYEDPEVGEELTTESDIIEVLAWGVRNTVISLADARLLTTVYMNEDRRDYGSAMERFGFTHDQARTRCSRAIAKLRAAAGDEFNGDAALSA